MKIAVCIKHVVTRDWPLLVDEPGSPCVVEALALGGLELRLEVFEGREAFRIAGGIVVEDEGRAWIEAFVAGRDAETLGVVAHHGAALEGPHAFGHHQPGDAVLVAPGRVQRARRA